MQNSTLLSPQDLSVRRSAPGKPELLSVWGKGQLLAFSGLDGGTDSRNGLCLRTRGDASVLEVVLPEEDGRLQLDERCPEQVYLASDHFSLRLADGSPVRGVFVDCHHLLLEGRGELTGSGGRIRTLREGKRMLLGVSEFFEPSLLKCDFNRIYRERAGFLNNCEYPFALSRDSRKTLAKAYSMLKCQIYAPEGRIKHRWSTPDRWPHRWMWLWDSAFHATGIRHFDPQLACDCISAVFDCQRADGFIAHCMTPYDDSNLTQPPVLGLGILSVLEVFPDYHWLREIYPKQAAYLKWIIGNRDADGAGLVEWRVEEDVHCRSGESGMDNSPRFDGAPRLDATDFNAYLAADCGYTARMAELLGFQEEAAFWRGEAERINRLINERLWNPQFGFYVDYDIDSGCQSSILSSAGFMPLLSGAASCEQAEELVRKLSDPETFGVSLGVPSISRNSDLYSKDLWRGPVWVNVNYLVTLGLERYGYFAEAEEIRRKTLREVEKFYLEYGTLFEYYDDRGTLPPPELPRKGRNQKEGNPYHQALHDFGWTAALYVEMLFHKKSLPGTIQANQEDNV